MASGDRARWTWRAGLCLALIAVGVYVVDRLREQRRYERHFDPTKSSSSVDLAGLERRLVASSELFTIDRIYKSMKGPFSLHDLLLESDVDPQLLWITGYEVEIIDGEGNAAPAEFMCHSNLDLDGDQHVALFGESELTRDRLFTLSQGETSVRFPHGFGLPILSSEPVRLYAQVLNLNEATSTFDVQQRVTIHYLRDCDLPFAMTPLFVVGANGYVLVEGDAGYFGVKIPDAETHGPGCAMGMNAGKRLFGDGLGREYTGHWTVPPGRHEYRSLVTRFMNVPFDTRVHHIAVHLHPFAVSTELIDRTNGESVFLSEATNFDDRIGLRRVDDWSSADGIPIYADHEYELVTVYDNTSGVDQDSMAVMFLYLVDQAFSRPRPRLLPAPPMASAIALFFALYLGVGLWLRRRVVAQ